MVTKTTIKGSKTEPVSIDGSGNLITIAKGASLTVSNSDYAIASDVGSQNNHVVVNGTITIFSNDYYAINLPSNHSSIEIRSSGKLNAGANGIFMQGDHISVDNAGTISALNGTGIILGSGSTSAVAYNSGKIFAELGVLIDADGKFINQHSGKVDAAEGLRIEGSAATVVNHGLFKSDNAAIYEFSGTLSLRNDGRIVGDLALQGNGTDVIDNRKGVIQGDILSGFGNDTLITDKANVKLTELANQGSDTVKSTVSYTLADNVEGLTLLGKKNINATGNDGAENYLRGNSGNNVLTGLAGYNEFFGMGGKDTLIGGNDVDLFGLGKHYGRDTVKGFEDGVDGIDIYRLGADNFIDMHGHIRDHGNDTWIVFGEDVLVLKGVDFDLIGADDFTYNY